MTSKRQPRRRPAVNRYVAGALTVAIAGVTIGALVTARVVITGHHDAIDGWGSAGAVTLIVVGLVAAALAALTMPRRS